ncbi:MAG: hypothetical protein HRU70_08195 [Phycisphaeraceae bacterium]|nr:MAG: hypothetical protein HRU70_08195 [Phycisphaeraceae bacterium]
MSVRKPRRFLLPGVIVVALAAGAMVLASCTAGVTQRHLAADQAGMVEAGRAMETAEMTIRMHERFHRQDPAAWEDLVTKAGRLSQSAGRLVLQRATAVSGVSDSEAIFARVEADTAALKTQRESLATDLARALSRALPE